MTITMDRRLLLQSGLFGLAAVATPGAARLLAARGFTHQVASGEPTQNSVLLWTRYVSEGEPVLRAEIAEDAEFGRIVARGETTARNAHDFTAKIVIPGLEPGRWYFYRFIAPDGTASVTGRTRTLPEGPVGEFTLGVFSCSNFRFGHFNAYRHAAARNDLDLIIHTGDYFYEYEMGRYPSEEQALAGRELMPSAEIIALADYWLRYATYRADPDLAALHRNFPMIARWDDHEIANDPWHGGAENHQPDEGDWNARKRAAMQAYHDWMPVSDAPWDSYQIGDLATIILPETRLTARSEQLDYAVAVGDGSAVSQSLAAFRDGPWSDEARTIMGAEQEAWVAAQLAVSTASGTRWQILGQQVIMGRTNFPLPLAAEIAGSDNALVRQRGALFAAATQAGLPLNLDAWDGYPAARTRLLASAQEADANLIVLSGDSHNAWAFDLHQDGANVGVEMAGHSVTSPGFESFLPQMNPETLAGLLVEASPDLRWTDSSRRGYLTVTLTPAEVRGEWLFLETVRERSVAMAQSSTKRVEHGARAFADG
ncbi:alkaline phosphatase D family protein [Parasphingopyxis lamellibrachiae]|uniref:Alkaline phosphatase D n=1 Tax=Parasphingopyxis lamellibrachiae TaxID=680125 RepID=A0A3D9FGB1_9SPHN|nr:alkaline phosphatase D family protein [Parasphingopyxis lamellibrachiae]RED16562.1 alkaline phosphatase D [Parasphingopyxis lamellibrachiae]